MRCRRCRPRVGAAGERTRDGHRQHVRDHVEDVESAPVPTPLTSVVASGGEHVEDRGGCGADVHVRGGGDLDAVVGEREAGACRIVVVTVESNVTVT